MRVLFILFLVSGLWGASLSWGKPISVLFIGNSYTYLPGIGVSSDPALPKMMKQIAESIDPTLQFNYEAYTPGGYRFEMHFHDPQSRELMGKHYDKVILQGQSIEALALTPWWNANGNPGVQSFSIYLPRVLDLVLRTSSDVTLFVNWGWHPRNTYLQVGHPGLTFPDGRPWCGRGPVEYQRLIDESYAAHASGYPVTLAKVGDAWLDLQSEGLVTSDALYVMEDWSHPSALGAYVAALVLVRDSLKLDIDRNAYFPSGVDPAQGRILQARLARGAHGD